MALQKPMMAAPIRSFYYPDANHHHLQEEPHIIVKRIVQCVGDRLRHIDPHRWESVPFTFQTHWNSELGETNIRTCILVHDAIEREFNVDIDDRKILLQSVNDCLQFIMQQHSAI